MFIVIYKEGSQHSDALEKETWAQVFSLSTPKYIFSWDGPDGGYELYKNPGIRHCTGDKSYAPFKHDKYTLTHIKKVIGGTSADWLKQFDFIFRYDNVKDVVITELSSELDFPRALSNAVKEIIRASKFESWEEYTQNKLEVKEIDKVKRENESLRKEVELLKKKIAAISKSE